MSQPTNPTPQTKTFYERHKETILIGAILYLFGVNQEIKGQLKNEKDRADKAELRYDKRLNDEVMAANRIAFRQMLKSDTTYFIGLDSVFRVPDFTKDSTSK